MLLFKLFYYSILTIFQVHIVPAFQQSERTTKSGGEAITIRDAPVRVE